MHRPSRWIGRLLAVVLVTAPAVATSQKAADAPAAASPQPPVLISADTAEYFNKENFVVFTGNVVAIQADSTLTADSMEVTFSQPEAAAGKAAAAIGTPAKRRITKIVALKNVQYRQLDAETKKERYATGDKGVYDAEERTVTMTGSPRVWEGQSVIVGEEMVFDLDEKKVVVRGKVNLKMYPDEAKEPVKP